MVIVLLFSAVFECRIQNLWLEGKNLWCKPCIRNRDCPVEIRATQFYLPVSNFTFVSLKRRISWSICISFTVQYCLIHNIKRETLKPNNMNCTPFPFLLSIPLWNVNILIFRGQSLQDIIQLCLLHSGFQVQASISECGNNRLTRKWKDYSSGSKWTSDSTAESLSRWFTCQDMCWSISL